MYIVYTTITLKRLSLKYCYILTVIYVGNDKLFTFTKIDQGVTMPSVPAGSPWLSLVSFDPSICDFVGAFAIIFSVIVRNLLRRE